MHHKDMLAVDHVPIAMLAIPIPVSVMVPVFMIPVVVFVSTSGAHHYLISV
jgi:hypothetical protein